MEKLPTVTASQMRAIDAACIEKYGLCGRTLMENAGRAIAAEMLVDFPEMRGKGCAILCGRGNNGGDGLVAARCLKASGTRAIAFIAPPEQGPRSELFSLNLERAQNCGVEIFTLEPGLEQLTRILQEAGCVLDAVFGTGAKGAPDGIWAEAITAANASGLKIAAADIPSGLDADTGTAHPACIRAAITYTIALPKHGLVAEQADPYVGELKILDIGFPEQAIIETLKTAQKNAC